MNDFLKRNGPVFTIGGLTLFIFVIIIVSATIKKPTKKTAELVQIDEQTLVATHTYIQGPEISEATIVVFSDFSCTTCKITYYWLGTLRKEFPDTLQVAFRHFPSSDNKEAFRAATAAQIAGEYGKFWEYVNILFENQPNFTDKELITYAKQLSIDETRFEEALKSKEYEGTITEDIKFGQDAGIGTTPAFFLNGTKMEFESYDEFRQLIVNQINSQKPIADQTQYKTPQQGGKNKPDPFLQSESFDKLYPPIEIKFTESEFEPAEIQAFQGQLVKWTNTINKPITIEQRIDKFDEFEDGITIEPGETYSFRLRDRKLWTYWENEFKARGAIFIRVLD